jgi:D-lactate dehydrogenase
VKISLFEVEEWEREALEALADEHEVEVTPEPLGGDLASRHRDAEAISTFMYSDLDPDVLDLFPELGFIATRSTGFDHIDAEYCREREIRVANVPTYGDHTVAEHVFALLLSISHHMVEAVDRTRRGDFSLQGLRGFDLEGRTLGLVGAGNIGRHAARIARGFGMEVVAYDVDPDPELTRELDVTFLPLDELLGVSDVISLHVPLNPETHHLLSDEEFDRMQEGVVIINTARGQVIDTQALLRALSTGKVRAAGLDVLPLEPVIREEAELLRSFFRKEHDMEALLADHVLLRMRNVVITPHSAFNTEEAVRRILDTTVENLLAWGRGEPRNVVIGGD